MKADARFWSTIAGTLLLWAAVAGVLIYNHHLDQANPLLSPADRAQRDNMLYVICAVFLIFNAAMTILRLQQIKRNQPPQGYK